MPKPSSLARAEVLPPAPTQTDLEKLVATKVAEALCQTTKPDADADSDALFKPFFGTREEAEAIKRAQRVTEQRKWRAYYAEYGCIHCHRTDELHQSLGFCAPCYARVGQRLRKILARSEAKYAAKVVPLVDSEKLAKEALAPSLAKLAPARRKVLANGRD